MDLENLQHAWLCARRRTRIAVNTMRGQWMTTFPYIIYSTFVAIWFTYPAAARPKYADAFLANWQVHDEVIDLGSGPIRYVFCATAWMPLWNAGVLAGFSTNTFRPVPEPINFVNDRTIHSG